MNQRTYSLAKLAEHMAGKLHGDGACQIAQASSLNAAQAGDICYADNVVKQAKMIADSQASAIIVNSKQLAHLPACRPHIIDVANPRLAFARLLPLFEVTRQYQPGIHPTAIIGQHCQIAETASIGPQVVIEEGVTIDDKVVIAAGSTIGMASVIGADTLIHSRVSIYHHTTIGKRCIIHSGAVLGADGFGFEADEQRHWVKVSQVGDVIIGDDVEIGANTTIDRASLDHTIIGNGVKLDNQIMIGHNVKIGDHTIIAGCTGVSGSTIIGKHCLIGGSCLINGHIEIGDYVVLVGTTAVHKSLPNPGVYSSGVTDVLPARQWHRNMTYLKQLDELVKRLKSLEKAINE